MIVNRYLQRNIYMGTLLALLVLISLNLFFLLVRELEDIGQGNYGFAEAMQYIALSIPARVVEFLPLAVLLGCILSLGALASNSEIIAMQASGVSLSRLLVSVLQAALVMAVISFLLSEWIVPDSSTQARVVKNAAQDENAPLRSREGVWIKDGNRVIHINQLLPNGFALRVQVYRLDTSGRLVSTLYAERAEPIEGGWELHGVEITHVDPVKTRYESFDRLRYQGEVSHNLLQVLMIKPSRMSRRDLHAYLNFLDDNRLDAKSERLIYWQKLFSPLTIVVMCLLAIPFILGAQRQSSTGFRLMMGILLGLSFAVIERLLTQLGNQFEFNAILIALSPNLLFLGIGAYLLRNKLSHVRRPGLGVGVG